MLLSHVILLHQVDLNNIRFNGQDLVIGVGLLLSYKKMGVAQLGCIGNCACVLKEYSTFIKQSGWSMTYWRFLEVKVGGPLPPSWSSHVHKAFD